MLIHTELVHLFNEGLAEIEQRNRLFFQEAHLLEDKPEYLNQYVALLPNEKGTTTLRYMEELPGDIQDEVVALFKRLFA